MTDTNELFGDLGLKNDSDAAKIDYKNLPKQRGTWTPPPQPGRYLFGFAGVAILKSKDPQGKPIFYQEFLDGTKKRLRVKFRDANALLNYGKFDAVGGAPTTVETQVSNNERAVGKAAVLTSDFANLLTALDSVPPEGAEPGNATDLQQLLLAIDAGKKFEGVTDLTATCSKESNAYVYDPEQDKNVDSDKPGCGRKYGTSAYRSKDGKSERHKIPEGVDAEGKAQPGTFATRFSCLCGASLNCFVNIISFHPPTQG